MPYRLQWYRFLNINWKLRHNDFTILKRPLSGDDPATYTFTSRESKASNVATALLLAASLDFSRRFFKHFIVTVIFDGVTHDEMLAYAKEHNSDEIYMQMNGT